MEFAVIMICTEGLREMLKMKLTTMMIPQP